MDAMDIESKLSDVTVTAIPLGGGANKRESSNASVSRKMSTYSSYLI